MTYQKTSETLYPVTTALEGLAGLINAANENPDGLANVSAAGVGSLIRLVHDRALQAAHEAEDLEQRLLHLSLEAEGDLADRFLDLVGPVPVELRDGLLRARK